MFRRRWYSNHLLSWLTSIVYNHENEKLIFWCVRMRNVFPRASYASCPIHKLHFSVVIISNCFHFWKESFDHSARRQLEQEVKVFNFDSRIMKRKHSVSLEKCFCFQGGYASPTWRMFWGLKRKWHESSDICIRLISEWDDPCRHVVKYNFVILRDHVCLWDCFFRKFLFPVLDQGHFFLF